MSKPNSSSPAPGNQPILRNRVILEGVLITTPEFRYTPAGRLVTLMEIEHISVEPGNDQPQRLELHMPIIALGTLAEQCRTLKQGDSISVEGQLNQKRWIRETQVRWGKTELLARRIRALDGHKEVKAD